MITKKKFFTLSKLKNSVKEEAWHDFVDGGFYLDKIRRCKSCKHVMLNHDNTFYTAIQQVFANECTSCKRCIYCCDCVFCGDCGDRQKNLKELCIHCTECKGCCCCRTCSGCSLKQNEFCGHCDRCRNGCCTCPQIKGASKVEFFCNPVTFHKAGKDAFTLNTSSRILAAEIEVANVDDDNEVAMIVDKWQGSIVMDGSLPSGGFEINTAPANGDLFVKQITAICQALRDADVAVDSSCGLHVHIDARDLHYAEISRLLRIYVAVEPTLFAMVPPSRRRSTYCQRCAEPFRAKLVGKPQTYRDVRKTVIDSVYEGENPQNFRGHKDHHNRYRALNLHSWFYRGTLECRLFNGTADAKKIISWATLWAHMVDYAKKTPLKEMAGVVPDVTEAPVNISTPELEAKAAMVGFDVLIKILNDMRPDLKTFVAERITTHTILPQLRDYVKSERSA